jgi:hypothetical protein
MKTGAVVVAVILGIGASGCETASRTGDVATETVRQHPGTAVGAGVGAAGGAVVGGVAGGSKGAIVGGLLGGLAGGVIGNYIERRDDNTASTSGSGTAPSSKSGQTTTSAATTGNPGIRMDQVQTVPAVVPPGGTVNLGATYTVFGSASEAVDVRETREVRHQGELVANPTAEVSRTRGTYTTSLPITLPATAAPGSYEVTTTVAMGDRRASQTSTFQVQ